MQAIFTQYKPVDHSGGARIIARATGGENFHIPYDYGKGDREQHDAAALALCRKLAWSGTLARGGGRKGGSFVYTFVAKDTIVEIK